jgi:hypothetical protein
MAHFALVNDNGVVENVIVVANSDCAEGTFPESEPVGQAFIASLGLTGLWLQTSYNTLAGNHRNGGTPFRKNYATPGFSYDSIRDAFIAPQPYASWTLNESTCHWEAPVPYPTDGGQYSWDEDTTSWVAVP